MTGTLFLPVLSLSVAIMAAALAGLSVWRALRSDHEDDAGVADRRLTLTLITALFAGYGLFLLFAWRVLA